MEPFNVGDVVELKGAAFMGWPRMLVEEACDDGSDTVLLFWLDKKHRPTCAYLPTSFLVRVELL